LTLIPYITWIFSGWAWSGILNGVVFVLFFPLFLYLKKRIVAPRVGMIKPGPARRRKMNLLVLATILAVLVTIAMIVFTGRAGGAASRMVAGIPMVFWAFSLAAVLITSIVAWLIDWPRLIVYGLLVAITIPVDAVYFLKSGRIPLTVIPMLVMVGTGIYLLVRFLRRYPLPQMGEMA
jgi:hypothetical protein